MIRNNLRVLEQKVNASDKLSDADKFDLEAPRFQPTNVSVWATRPLDLTPSSLAPLVPLAAGELSSELFLLLAFSRVFRCNALVLIQPYASERQLPTR
jgi:hypothetical protein